MSFISEALAIARKEILIDLRFAVAFLLQSVASPVARILPILIVYAGILAGRGESPIPGITGDTYVPFLMLGILFYTAWTRGTDAFIERFRRDKYMRTVDLLFIAPIRVLAIILGVGIAVVVNLLPTIILLFLAMIVASPPTAGGFLLAVSAFLFTYVLGVSVGLIYGGATLATENMSPFFMYALHGLALLAPFFYPFEILETLPDPLPVLVIPLVRLNPLNAGIAFARAAWYGGGSLPWLDLLYLVTISVVTMFAAAHLFRFFWRRMGVQG